MRRHMPGQASRHQDARSWFQPCWREWKARSSVFALSVPFAFSISGDSGESSARRAVYEPEELALRRADGLGGEAVGVLGAFEDGAEGFGFLGAADEEGDGAAVVEG